MKQVIIALIRLYQKTLSPDHGLLKANYPHGFCRFYPSCSEYAAQSIQKYGIVKGVYKGTLRILKCNPFSKPKIDVV